MPIDTNYGRLLLDATESGWNQGRQMIADFRDTQELLKRRTQEEEANKELGKIKAQLDAGTAKYNTVQEEYSSLLAQQDSGFTIDERELSLAQEEMDRLLQSQLTTMFDAGAQLHLSTNPFLASKGKEFLDQAQNGLKNYQEMYAHKAADVTARRGQDLTFAGQRMSDANDLARQTQADEAALARMREQERGENTRAGLARDRENAADKTRSLIALMGVAATMGPEEAAKNPQLKKALADLGFPAFEAPAPESPLTPERKALKSQLEAARKRLDDQVAEGKPLSKRDQTAKRLLNKRIKDLEQEDQDEAVYAALDDRNWLEKMFTPHPMERGDIQHPGTANQSAARSIAKALGVDDVAESREALEQALAQANGKAPQPRSRMQALGLAQPEDTTEHRLQPGLPRVER